MLNTIQAYSLEQNAPSLPLDANGKIDTDFFQVQNITGLDPVKATINTTQFGSIDGAAYSGSSVPYRNIVITLRANPDWITYKPQDLRKLLYAYFAPKKPIELIFISDDRDPMAITGYVEDMNSDFFSPDNAYQISIICPDPYFTSVDPVIVTGHSQDPATTLTYIGDVPVGINLGIESTSHSTSTDVDIRVGDPWESYFNVTALIDDAQYFVLSSVPGSKVVETVLYESGTAVSQLSNVHGGSTWPLLIPGDNLFNINTDQGTQDWTVTYYNRFVGL
jgi:hypothetical protein